VSTSRRSGLSSERHRHLIAIITAVDTRVFSIRAGCGAGGNGWLFALTALLALVAGLCLLNDGAAHSDPFNAHRDFCCRYITSAGAIADSS
jgi:hypothetical protein